MQGRSQLCECVCVCVGALCENRREKEKDLRRANTAKATNDDHHDEAQRKKSEEPRERKKERKAGNKIFPVYALRFPRHTHTHIIMLKLKARIVCQRPSQAAPLVTSLPAHSTAPMRGA